MKIVIQRVSEASVSISGKKVADIQQGLLILLGIENADTKEDIVWLCRKAAHLRIFNDEKGLMNLSVKDIAGQIIVVSQFTLHASTKKGNRPSFIKAAKPDVAIPLYEKFVEEIQGHLQTKVQTGEFGADMKISLINDGPVTIVIDSQMKV
ncbi:MAG: D-aminoacyl-tRNA deacylase [Chitinophagales bacterium]